MADAPDTLPIADVSIVVPRAYKDVLVHNRGWRWLFAFAAFAVLLSVWYLEWRRGRHFVDFVPHLLTLVVAFPLWLYEVKKPWHYVISDRHMSLVLWQFGGRAWQWHDLDWRRDVVLSVETADWRSLPALRVKAKLKGAKREQDLWMVYAPQDQEKVQREVLPLIESYRKQYRHELWADQLRS